ncbi:hypothetical protein [Dyadobacter sp. 3J3]|uniref:hypothetical protein n=1 Tax=Dyadobacter sp. 3J3 TaxID=2606600 RepID=UPI0013597278|nr:hypothetical protein [Dyadobacter sp. 3J3]
MSRNALIKIVLGHLSKLSDREIEKVSKFAGFLLSKSGDSILVEGIQKIASESKSFDFLHDEDDIYTVADLKEIYK